MDRPRDNTFSVLSEKHSVGFIDFYYQVPSYAYILWMYIGAVRQVLIEFKKSMLNNIRPKPTKCQRTQNANVHK